MVKRLKKKGAKSQIFNLPGSVNEMAGEFNRRMDGIGGTVNRMSSNLAKGLEAASTLRESFSGVLGSAMPSVAPELGEESENTIIASVKPSELAWIDVVVESGIAGSREEAASLFIEEGVKARLGQLKLVQEKVNRLRQEQE